VGGFPSWRVAVSSRNYAEAPLEGETRRFGIAIPGLSTLDEPLTSDNLWVLPGLRQAGDVRTNLIMAGAVPGPSSVTIRLIADETVVATDTRTVPGYGLLQINRVAEVLGAGTIEDGYVQLSVASGGVFAALSVVDGTADDAAFVVARPVLPGS